MPLGYREPVEIKTLQGHSNSVTSVAFSSDSKTLVSGSLDRQIRIWNVDNAECHEILDEHTDGVWRVAFNLDNTLLASSSDDETIKTWDTTTWELLNTFESDKLCARMNITGVALTNAQRDTLAPLGATIGKDDNA